MEHADNFHLSTLGCRRGSIAVQIPTFCQIIFRYCGFIFFIFVHVWFSVVSLCTKKKKKNPHMLFYFFPQKCLSFFFFKGGGWGCNSSNRAQPMRGEAVGTLESSTQRLCLLYTEIACCTFCSSTSSSLRKRTIEVGNMEMISHSPPTQANRR